MFPNNQIFIIQNMSFDNGNFSLLYSFLIRFHRFFILSKSIPRIGNCTHSQSHHQLSFAGSVSHEIPVNFSVDHGLIKIVMFQREMIHTNFFISQLLQKNLAVFVKFAFFVSTRKVNFIKTALPNSFYPRNVSVGIKSQTIRPQFQRFTDCKFHFLPTMERQTKNEIMRNTGITYFAGPTCDLFHIFKRLNSVDGFLDLRIVILNAKTASSESQIVKSLKMFPRRVDWMSFTCIYIIYGYFRYVQNAYNKIIYIGW